MSDRIRVSCASLCRIEHAEAYFLLLNINRMRRGIYVLSPIGGALELYDETRLAAFDARHEVPGSHDLRLSLPVTRLNAFANWFYSGQGRERSPFRELREELVSESRLLPALDPDEATCEHLWTVEDEGVTLRQGQTGVLTHYFLEIYDVRLADDRLTPLLTPPPNSGAKWVTAAQITARNTAPIEMHGVTHRARVNGYYLLYDTPPRGK